MDEKNSETSQPKRFNMILFGAPGSGKGTQSQKIVERYNLQHISTGDLIRKEVAEKSELGIFAADIIAKGQLLPDDIMIEMIKKEIVNRMDDKNGFIFDGFPRTVAQAEAMENLCSNRGGEINLLLRLHVKKEELINRLLSRGQREGRSDDSLEIINNRLEIYTNQTKPVIDFYAERGKRVQVEGIGTVDEVFDRISKAIDEKLNK